jgi:hypothetical protein
MIKQQQTFAASTESGAKSSAELEREVRQSRAEVEDTLDAIQDRLSPGQMADQFTHYMRENGGEFARNLGQMVKQNPVPVMLVGVGLAWMMLGSRRELPRAADLFDDDDELGYDPGYAGARESWSAYEPGSASSWRADGDEEGRASAAARRAREGLSEAADRVRTGFDEAGEAVQDAGARVGRLARGARSRAAGMGAGVARRARRTGARARQYGEGWAQALHEHPLVLGTVGFAIGAAIAAALPASRREDELMGEASDSLKQRGRAMGRQGYVKAEAAAGAAYSAAAQEAKEQGLSREGVESAAEAVRHKVGNVAGAATEAAKQEAFGDQEASGQDRESGFPDAGFRNQESGFQTGSQDQEAGHRDRGVGEPTP